MVYWDVFFVFFISLTVFEYVLLFFVCHFYWLIHDNISINRMCHISIKSFISGDDIIKAWQFVSRRTHFVLLCNSSVGMPFTLIECSSIFHAKLKHIGANYLLSKTYQIFHQVKMLSSSKNTSIAWWVKIFSFVEIVFHTYLSSYSRKFFLFIL